MKKYTGTPEEVLALKTFTKLMRSAELVSSEVHAGLAGFNLSVSQFGVLEALLHLGPMCQKEIAQKVLKSCGNITMVIDNLEKRKLVIRKKNKEDRRFFNIELTEKGKKLIESIFPEHAKRITRKMAVLEKAEQQEIGRLLRKFKKLKEKTS